MQKKNTLLTVTVIILFIASGGVLYFGLFNSSGNDPSSSPIDANQKNIINLMPYGETLKFDVIKSRTDVEAPYNYKIVTPQEVGHTVSDMLRNLDLGVESSGVPNPSANLEGRDLLLPR